MFGVVVVRCSEVNAVIEFCNFNGLQEEHFVRSG